MTGQKWVRSSLRSVRDRLAAGGHQVSAPTVGRLLKGLGFSLRVNSKKIEASSNHPDRNQQFDYIAVHGAVFAAAGLPIISTDTKKKELIGDFKNAGKAWVLEPTAVNVHDFPGDALGRAVPYGVYDLTNNRGLVYVGKSGDTPAFAADAIAAWWQADGRATWPDSDHFLVLADAGGSNNCRARAWKERVQVQICDRFGVSVTVCHYPTGFSKWNPIERRLFSHISNNWAGVPLRTWDTMLASFGGPARRLACKCKPPSRIAIIPPARKSAMLRWPHSASNHTRSAHNGTTPYDLELQPRRRCETPGTCFLSPPKWSTTDKEAT
jgi:hypothetical protein